MIPLNVQPNEKADYDPAGSLDVQEIWYTLQGEGPLAGTPAVFCRLAGCDLACPQCDTDYTSSRRRLRPEAIFTTIKEVCLGGRLVVLTGGEPFRQNIGPLCQLLWYARWPVQVETNGTLFVPMLDVEPLRSFHEQISVVCSPKTGTVNEKLKPWVSALKYVLDAEHVDPDDGLPTDVLGGGVRPARPWPGFAGEVFVQPADSGDVEQNRRNTQAAVFSCLQFGYRLSYQIHKAVGLP